MILGTQLIAYAQQPTPASFIRIRMMHALNVLAVEAALERLLDADLMLLMILLADNSVNLYSYR